MLTIGTVIKMSTAVDSTTFGHTLGKIRNIGRSGMEAQQVEIKTLDDAPYEIFESGWINGGEMPLTVLYTPDSTTACHGILNSMFLARRGGRFKAIHPTTTITEEFNANVSGIGREYPIDGFIAQDFTLKVTGAPGLSVTT